MAFYKDSNKQYKKIRTLKSCAASEETKI